MGTLTADHAASRTTVADLRTAATQLSDDRDRAARSVDGLLGTWSGTVATAYAAGWDDWCAGADRVLSALGTMASVLERADADLTSADVGAGSDLGRLTARLG